MSLINDMLKDLDAQRSHPNVECASALRGLGLAGPASHTRDYTTLTLYACGLMLVMMLALPWVMQLVQQPAVSRTAPLPIPEQATEIPRVKPAVRTAREVTQIPVEVVAAQEAPSQDIPPVATLATNNAETDSRQQADTEHNGGTILRSGTITTQPAAEQPQLAQAADPQIDIVERPLTHGQQQQYAYHNAVAAMRTGNYPGATRQLQQVLALNSSHHQARLMLANLLLKQQQHAEAESLLATGLSLDPLHAPFAMLYAQLLIAQAREQEAIQSLQTALPGAGQDADYHAFLAALYQRNGKPLAAIRRYETALGQAPQKGEWWMGLGISQEQAGNLPVAYQAYQRALQLPLKPVLQQYIQTRLKILSR